MWLLLVWVHLIFVSFPSSVYGDHIYPNRAIVMIKLKRWNRAAHI